MNRNDLLNNILVNFGGKRLPPDSSRNDILRHIELITRDAPKPLKKWTPNYTGQGYVEIPEWHGVAGDVVEFDLEISVGVVTVVLDCQSPRYYFLVNTDGSVSASGGYNYAVDGVESGKIINNKPHKIRLTAIKNVSVTHIGANYVGVGAVNGTIKNIKLTKADGSDNRFYESVIESETQPTTLELVDSISGQNGTMINFPAEAWTDKYNLANVTWDMSNRELVKFTRSTKVWLDGKEYAPDEPRYTKDGELLVEGQATNLMPSSSSPTRHSGPLVGWGNAIQPAPVEFDGYISFDLKGDAGKQVGFYMYDTAYNIIVTLDGSGRGRFNYKITRYHDIWFGVDAVHYPSIINPASFFEVSNFQLESGVVATSYIPTATTAVTRAADIATVRDK